MTASSIAGTTSQPGRCTLLGLPAELRNRIWELVIPQNSTIRFCEGMSTLDRDTVLPPLLRTSTQIRRETLRTFFGSNTFDIFFITSFDMAIIPSVYAVGSNWAMVSKVNVQDYGVQFIAPKFVADFSKKTVELELDDDFSRFGPALRGKEACIVKFEAAKNLLRRKEGIAIQSAEDMLGFLSVLGLRVESPAPPKE